MKVLIIGYGSIGKRHEQVLQSIDSHLTIDLVTKQTINDHKCYSSIEAVSDISSYDYFVIASETVKHFEQLVLLEKLVQGKKILCEKPLFDNSFDFKSSRNKIWVGYNLRFHPLLQKLKQEISGKKIWAAHSYCGQYLPDWRPQADYRQSYSARKDRGGGVLLDLSHELDYMQWLFGSLTVSEAKSIKVSNLEIDSDDITSVIAGNENVPVATINLDYLSQMATRRILVHAEDASYEADFIAGTLSLKKKNEQLSVTSFKVDRNHTYAEMHSAIINNHANDVCDLHDGLTTMKLIEQIRLSSAGRK